MSTSPPPSPQPAAPAGRAQPPHRLIASVILFIVVVGTFWPALSNSYVNYDDPDYLITNPQVQAGLNWANVKWAFSATAASNWHPLTWLSHMLDCQVFGPRLWAHHLTNVVLHGLNAVLVFLLFHRCTGRFWRSLILAAVFGLHPLRVESVAWLSERKDVLSAGFGLAALLAYVHYTGRRGNRGGAGAAMTNSLKPDAQAALLYAAALALFALSLLSKPMMVTLPCVMLLLDWWPLQRNCGMKWWPLVREKIPFLILSAVLCWVTYAVQRSGGAMEQMAQYSGGHHVANAVVSYVRYLGKFFWPAQLAPIYPVVNHWPIAAVAGAAGLLAAVTAAAFWLRTRAAYGLMGWLWFLGTLVPVIGLVAVGEQAMADRYTYFTQIGLALLLIWGGAAPGSQWRWWRPAAAAGCGIVLFLCAAATRQQIRVWADSETLFRHTLAVTKDNYSAHANLATALQEQRRPEEALFHASEAARLRPDSPETLGNLGASLARLGRLEEARTAFEAALRLRPDFADAHRNFALALQQSGRLDEAIAHYAEAVRLVPEHAGWHQDYGLALARAGRLDDAIAQFQQAVKLEPRHAAAHLNLAEALTQQGRVNEAAHHLQEAARLNASGSPRQPQP